MKDQDYTKNNSNGVVEEVAHIIIRIFLLVLQIIKKLKPDNKESK